MKTKIFLLRGVVFSLLFISLSLLIEYQIDNSKEKPTYFELTVIQNSLNENADIIYFGDSIIIWPDPKDTDLRSISTMLQNETNRNVTSINHASYRMDMFEVFSRYICSYKNKPKLVIIEINLRTFSPEWDTPEAAYPKETEIITNRIEISVFSMLWMRFYNLFGGNSNLSTESSGGITSNYEDWWNETVYYNTTPIGKVKEFDYSIQPVNETTPDIENLIRNKYIYCYLYNLNSSNKVLIYLSNLIDNYKGCNVPVLAYITPVDYERGVKYTGENFTKIVKGNVNTIINLGKTKGITIYDMSFDLVGANLSHWSGSNPSEHLTQEGRLYVAQRLSDIIRSNFTDGTP